MLCHLKEEMGIRSTSTLTLHNATIKYWGRNANNIYVIETVGQGMGAGDWVGCTLNHLRSDPPTTPAPFFFCLQIQFDPQRNPLTLIQSKWGTERVKELKYYKKLGSARSVCSPELWKLRGTILRDPMSIVTCN